MKLISSVSFFLHSTAGARATTSTVPSAATSSLLRRSPCLSRSFRVIPLALTAFTGLLRSSMSSMAGGGGGGSSSTSTTSDTCINASAGAEIDAIRRLIPPLSYSARKGQMGRIGILGGSADFTGAPYYASLSSLKVGGDLSYVFTAEEAAGPLKTYSPELMVTPVYSAHLLNDPATKSDRKEQLIGKMVDKVKGFLPKMNVLVIGPGLGREPAVMEATKRIILEAKTKKVPLVIDADGLWLLALEPALLKGYPGAILTPNGIEFARLQAGVQGASIHEATPSMHTSQYSHVMELAAALGGVDDKAAGGEVIVMLKGREDTIADAERWMIVTEEGSKRRSGGQGDILAGTTGVLLHWARMLATQGAEGNLKEGKGGSSSFGGKEEGLWACAAASVIVRRASKIAFREKRRSMTAPDVIVHLGTVLEEISPTSPL